VTVYSPLAPLSDAIGVTLRASAALLALAPGGVWDALPQNSSYPVVLVEVLDDYQPSLGRRPGGGPGSLYELDVRVHVFTQDRGMRTAQVVMAKVVEVLTPSGAISVTGYTVCGLEPLATGSSTPLPNEVVAGIPVRELVRDFRLTVEES
jgi:hypothetical protein